MSSALQIHSVEPLCAGPDPAELVEHYVTPTDLHFVRNHAPIPYVDVLAYRLVVDGLVDRPLELSLSDLSERFERHSAEVTLQCAGNRRSELDRIRPIENQVLWTGDAIGTAEWTGVRLADVLRAVGAQGRAAHVWFDGLDRVKQGETTTSFGSSIPLARALVGDVLLADEMNGEPLPPRHGAPLRVVVPGLIGARSVKWLARITVSDRPTENHFQTRSYLLEGANGSATSIQDGQLNSFVSSPRHRSAVEPGELRIRGYAIGGGTAPISAVEVSVDGGGWLPASLLDRPKPSVWVRWEAVATLDPGTHEIRVRATDAAGGVQPDDMAAAWNAHGYFNNATQTITLRAGR